MTMQLLGPAFTTTSTKKRKSNIVINAKLTEEFREHNKLMKRVGSKQKTLEEYIQYRKGKAPATNRAPVRDTMTATTLRRESPVVQSGVGVGVAFAKKPNQYSGERKLIGIGTMHKSNMVPIFEQSDAEEIARMRRG